MTNREYVFNSSLKMGSVLCLILTLILLNFSSFGDSNLMVNATEPAPLFHVHMIAPTSNPIRMQAAHLIERELESIGISCDLDLLNWGNLGPRSYYDTVGPYNEGGYDIAFIGMTLGNVINHPVDTLMSSFGVDSYPPFGYNMMYWSNATEPGGSQEGLHTWNSYRAGEQNQLLADIRVETNLTTVKEMFDDWQKIYYDAMPQALVYNQLEVHAISAGLYGYDPVLPYPFSSTEDFWTTADYTGTADEVILAAAAGGDEFFSILTGDIYDQYSAAHVWDGLVGVTPSKNTVLPAGTDRTQWMQNRYGITDYLAVYPRLAKDMGNFSSDLLNYTIELDQGHYFHDGHEIDAWDVVFSFQAHLLPELSSLTYSTRKSCFGTDADGMGHGNSSFIAKDTNIDGFYETIDFNFMNPYSPFVIDLLGTAILPEHILGDNDTTHGWTGATAYTGSFDPNTEWQARPDSWQTHSFNTGDPSDAGGFKGPIGSGSLIFYDRNPTSGVITMKKWDGYQWGGSNWVTGSGTGYQHYRAAAGDLDEMPTTYKIVPTLRDSAITEFKTGNVNIMDPDYNLDDYHDDLQGDAAIQAILIPQNGWQALYLHPEYQGADGVYHLKKKGVRHAISHIIPRELMRDGLLEGFIRPAYTPLPLNSWAAISEADLLAYKKTLQATDGSYPEQFATTAWDSFDRSLALDWLETEGYDVTAWRTYTPPPPPSWPTSDAQQWDPRIKAGLTLRFNVEQVLDQSFYSDWYWNAADVTFIEWDTIEISWNSDPYNTEIVGNEGPVTYPITVTINGAPLDPSHSRQFGWFILPLVTTNGLGEHESGIRSAERWFSWTMNLINPSYSGPNQWNIVIDDDTSLHNTGGAASPGSEIHAHIISCTYNILEERVFNLTYDAQFGWLNQLTFTNTMGGDPSSGKIDSEIVQGLQRLVITRDFASDPPFPPPTTIPPTTPPTTPPTSEPPISKSTTTTSRITPSWSIIFTLSTLLIIRIGWRKINR